ncbi:hypothetical protein JR316_0006514 [Psilocybe cubensis]|uniref:Uncharacterized protein n=1 Tax=Psilocybe cubensis TaxID=181762 RepID=A0ACB8H433_PSICU|nr:hypothetical protein JR316_0006514 [Psilocybe cubensis]KAH9481984.1 hypothetical protein JR316_0006514 [Psilocybe cubensis]
MPPAHIFVITSRFDDAAGPASQNIRDIIVFDVLYGVGLVLLILLLFTALFSPRHIKRGPTWFLMLVGWIITSMGNLIIVGQQTGPPPSQAICLFQAMLVYASPVLTSSTAFVFVFQVYMSFRMAANSSNQPMLSRKQVAWMNFIPWIGFVAVLVEILIIGIKNPNEVRRNEPGTYCSLSGSIGYGVTAGLTVLAMLAVLVMEFLTGRILRRVWKNSETVQLIRNNELFSIETMARLGIFCFCPMIALAVSCLQYFPGHSNLGASLQLAIAILPCCAILIFGSQKDIVRAWTCQKS